MRIAHPDYLLEPLGPLTWDQFTDWLARFDDQPWGEERADARGVAHTMIGLAPYSDTSAKLPQGDWPYWESQSDSWNKKDALARIKAYNAQNNG